MVSAGASGQAQLIGADWGGVWAYPWIHLRQKEARQWEYMNERSKMSQLVTGKMAHAPFKDLKKKVKNILKAVVEEFLRSFTELKVLIPQWNNP